MKYSPAKLAKDSTYHHGLVKQGKIWEHAVYKYLFHEVPGDTDQLLCLPTQRQVWKYSDGRNGAHDASEYFLAMMKKHMLAVDLFGGFDMTAIPEDPNRVPSLKQMRAGYGDKIPAYDTVNQYLPVNVRLTNCKAQSWVQVWPCRSVMGMAVVFWDGTGGPGHFRQPAPQGPLLANWALRSELSDDGHLCVRVPCVFTDPVFTNTSRVQTEKAKGTDRHAQEAEKIQEHICIYIYREREREHIHRNTCIT